MEARAQAAEKEKLLVREIHKKIVATSTENSEAGMKLYTNTVTVPNRGYSRDRTGPSVTFVSVMVPIKGGEFTMGSPEAEKDHQTDEGPQHKVEISPFYMQQCEITWDEFEPFMQNFEAPAYKDKNSTYVSNYLDGVSKPSKPYVPPDRGMFHYWNSGVEHETFSK